MTSWVSALVPDVFKTRGVIEILPTWRGLPWHSLSISSEQAVIRSLFGRVWELRRADATEVEYRRVRLLLVMRTQIIFRATDGRRIPPFISGRPRRVLAALRERGWPVRETGLLTETLRRTRLKFGR